jgi:tripartite-type tricarboxylate transporter receptor subunit TctC
MMFRRLGMGVLALLACGPLAAAPEVDWPAQPTKFLVGYPAGGPTDSVARILADALSKASGRQVIVENRPGADGAIAVNAVVRAAPDSANLVVSLKGAMTVAPVVSKLPYEPLTDLTPLAILGQSPIMVSARADLGVRTLADLVPAYTRRGGKISVGYVGAFNRMVAVQLMQELKIDLLLVPYKGGPAAMNDLLGGQVDLMVGDAAGPLIGKIQNGRVIGLAVTSAARVPDLPAIPTVAEAGFASLTGTQWYGLWGPRDLPEALAERIHKAATAVMAEPQALERLRSAHVEPFVRTRADMKALMKSEDAHWREVARKAGIQPE